MKTNEHSPTLPNGTEVIDLVDIVLTLFAHKYKIIITTLLCALLAFLYSVNIEPLYTASVLVQLERNTQNNLISKLMDPLIDESTSSATEIGILTSRRVLNQTIDALGLQIDVREKKFPFIGRWLSAFTKEFPHYISVSSFNVPTENEDKPWTLTVLGPDRYQIETGEAGVVSGKTHQTLKQNGFTLNVAALNAPAGTTFILTKYSKYAVIQSLLKRLTAVELNKDSRLLNVSFSGPDKQKIIAILNNISLNFMEDNRQRKAEEASKKLNFVNSLLPGVLEKLNQADRQLHNFKEENGSIDLPMEVKVALDSSVAIQSQQNELQLAKVELSKKYTSNHPVYRALLEKEALLNKDKNALSQVIAAMPKKQQEILSIKRDIEAGQEIYMQLLSRQHELGIASASTVASIRIIDEAVSNPIPIGSNKWLNIILGALLGGILSCGYCLALHVFRRTLEDVETIERHGVDVLASIPGSEYSQRKRRHKLTSGKTRQDIWLAQEHPQDLAIEALRSLRTGIFIALKQAGKNSLLISGATSGAGKTFISSNLAAIMADTGKSILLIDADLRLGKLHELLGVREKGGVSEILQGSLMFEEAIQPTARAGLDIISRGSVSGQSSELLGSDLFAQLLQWAQLQYDYVIVDTPPILAITDAGIVAEHVGLVLLVLRYKTNSVKELSNVINRFKKCGIELDRAVFNGVQNGESSAYKYARYSTSL